MAKIYPTLCDDNLNQVYLLQRMAGTHNFLLKLVHVIGNELVSKLFLEVVRKILGGLQKPSKMLCDKKEGFETPPSLHIQHS